MSRRSGRSAAVDRNAVARVPVCRSGPATHANAILALTNTRGREKTIRECFGESLITVPCRRPLKAGAAGIVLMNRALITWGNSAKEAYDRHRAG